MADVQCPETGVDTYKSKIWALAEPIVVGLGLEVLEVELAGAAVQRVVRVYLDSRGVDRAVTLEDCQQVARRLGDVLDAHGAIDGDYMLEVSSPGLDRPLRKREHFERVIGDRIKLKTHKHQEGRKNFAGRLDAIRDSRLTIATDDGNSYEFELAEIDKANLQYEFETPAQNLKKRPNH